VYTRAAQPQYNVVAAAMPVRGRGGKVLGILVLQVKIDTLLRWAGGIETGPLGAVTVTDHRGRLAAHPRFPPQGEIVDAFSVPSVRMALSGEKGIWAGFNPVEREEQLAAFEPVPGYGWTVVLQQPAAAAFAPKRRQLDLVLYVYGLFFVLNAALAWLVLRILGVVDRQRSRERTFLQSIGDAVFAIDRRYRAVLWNDVAVRLSGWQAKEVLGRPFHEFVKFRQADRDNVAFIEEAMATGRVYTVEEDMALVAKDGRAIPVADSAAPIVDDKGRVSGAIVVFRDVTESHRLQRELADAKADLERRIAARTADLAKANADLRAEMAERQRVEAQMRHAQKMEVVGQLAGGIAHDFNNVLTVISGYSEMRLGSLAPGDPARADFEEILKAGRRASGLVSQLLTFSRRQVFQPKVINLNDLILDMEKMLRRLIVENIEFVVLAAPDLAPVRVDPGYFHQVLSNLVINAAHASPSGGKIVVETKNVTLDGDYARRHAEAKPGDYVMLAVSDTGVGMTEEVKSHLFEPFFTTKEQGKGTGLGLPTVYGIVKQSGGTIEVYSEPGRGTSFKIYLPCVAGKAEAWYGSEKADGMPRGSETVLIVEDEASVRSFAARVLEGQGYAVLEAADGAEALRAARDGGRKIQVLLTDMVMPQMGGQELAEKLKPLCPGVRVVFMSGYTENASIHAGRLNSGEDFLQKPFSPRALAHKIRQVLDGRDGGGRPA
jgi:PAS domain S-box-containing protein